jgi:hypothetical protein
MSFKQMALQVDKCQTILRNKYLSRQTIGSVDRKPKDSHFWTGLMKAKSTFFVHGSFRLNNGK